MVSSEGVFEGGEGAEDECYWMVGKGNRREVGGMSVGVLTVFGRDRTAQIVWLGSTFGYTLIRQLNIA